MQLKKNALVRDWVIFKSQLFYLLYCLVSPTYCSNRPISRVICKFCCMEICESYDWFRICLLPNARAPALLYPLKWVDTNRCYKCKINLRDWLQSIVVNTSLCIDLEGFWISLLFSYHVILKWTFVSYVSLICYSRCLVLSYASSKA